MNEEEFEAWWLANQRIFRPLERYAAHAAWLASREATAKRCVEIAISWEDKVIAGAIEREFGGKP